MPTSDQFFFARLSLYVSVTMLFISQPIAYGMDYATAKKLLKTDIATTFCKTKFRNAELRRKALVWATQLPSGADVKNQIETMYHKTYRGAEIRFGKPGKETKRKRRTNRLT